MNIIDIQLVDNFPSAIGGYTTIRQCLWNIVESVVGIADNAQIIDYYISEYDSEITDIGLPVSFAGKNVFESNNRNKKRKTFSEFRSENNIYMGKNKVDGKYYACRVIGVGRDTDYSFVYFVGYGTFAELHRQTELLDIPQEILETVQEAIVNEIIETTTLHSKYYDQRYRFFSKYDLGMQLDHESWFSITPEVIANDVAEKCVAATRRSAYKGGIGGKGGIVLDCFSGVGGNAIALAKLFDVVIACDIDATKSNMLSHNAKLYDVSHKLDILTVDSVRLLAHLARDMNYGHVSDSPLVTDLCSTCACIDIIILAPPWGGVDYISTCKKYDLLTMINVGNKNGYELLEASGKYISAWKVQDACSILWAHF